MIPHRPSLDYPNVDRGAPGQVSQAVQTQDLMSHFLHGADTLFRLVSGVGRPAGDLHLEHADTFSARLQRPFGTGAGLKTKHLGAFFGLFFDQLPGSGAPYLFVGVDYYSHPLLRSLVVGPQRFQSVHRYRDSGLHV